MLSQAPGAPLTSVARLAIKQASTTASRPKTRAAITLAAITLPRCGSRVNVTMPVRWVHSWVTSRIPITGSRKPWGVAMIPM